MTGMYPLPVSDIVESVGVLLDIELNQFLDEDGYPIYNILDYISPNDLYLVRHAPPHDTHMTFPHVSMKNMVVEIYWPDDNDAWLDAWDGKADTLCHFCHGDELCGRFEFDEDGNLMEQY